MEPPSPVPRLWWKRLLAEYSWRGVPEPTCATKTCLFGCLEWFCCLVSFFVHDFVHILMMKIITRCLWPKGAPPGTYRSSHQPKKIVTVVLEFFCSANLFTVFIFCFLIIFECILWVWILLHFECHVFLNQIIAYLFFNEIILYWSKLNHNN